MSHRVDYYTSISESGYVSKPEEKGMEISIERRNTSIRAIETQDKEGYESPGRPQYKIRGGHASVSLMEPAIRLRAEGVSDLAGLAMLANLPIDPEQIIAE